MNSRGQRPRKPYHKNIDPAGVALFLQPASVRPLQGRTETGGPSLPGALPPAIHGYPLRGSFAIGLTLYTNYKNGLTFPFARYLPNRPSKVCYSRKVLPSSEPKCRLAIPGNPSKWQRRRSLPPAWRLVSAPLDGWRARMKTTSTALASCRWLWPLRQRFASTITC